MDQLQSSEVRPTTLNRKKKIVTKPPANPIIEEIQDELIASHETPNNEMGDSKEDIPRQINGGLLDLPILKSFETHVAYVVSKIEVNKDIFGLS